MSVKILSSTAEPLVGSCTIFFTHSGLSINSVFKVQGVPQLCTTFESLIKYSVFAQSCGFWLHIAQDPLLFCLTHFRSLSAMDRLKKVE